MQHRYVENGDYGKSDVIKNADDRRKRTFEKEKHDTASQLLKEFANRNLSR